VAELGHRWFEISRRLPGRTDHAIRNRWSRLQAIMGVQQNSPQLLAAAGGLLPAPPPVDLANSGGNTSRDAPSEASSSTSEERGLGAQTSGGADFSAADATLPRTASLNEVRPAAPPPGRPPARAAALATTAPATPPRRAPPRRARAAG